MDLDNALQAHAAWKTKFRAAMTRREKLDAATIGKDNCCDFGKWLHGDARKQYATLASYQECVKGHAAFHVQAAQVASTINAGQYEQAEKAIGNGTPFANASNVVGAAIMRLKKEARL